jgi:hypothetical protein
MAQCDSCNKPMTPAIYTEEGTRYSIWSCSCGFWCDRTILVSAVDLVKVSKVTIHDVRKI